MMASQQMTKAKRKLRILTKGKPFSNIASREKIFMSPIEFAKNEKRTKLEANNIVLSRGNFNTFKSKSYKILEMNNFTDLE